MQYAPAESTLELMRALKSYILAKGIPMALYVDQDSIYRTTRQPSIEEQLRDQHPLTQFTRAAKELGIEVICANSPQAKGRVERSFCTHQDRLVKENRLRGVSNPAEGTEVLANYVKQYNASRTVKPLSDQDLFRPAPTAEQLDQILCLRETRKLAKDFTIKYKHRLIQIEKNPGIQILTRNNVIVETRLNGEQLIRYQNHYLA